MLRKYTKEYQNAEVVRSRDPVVWEQSDILVDVGGKYNPPKQLDHHQIEFQHTYPNHNIRLSSAGLVYLHFPEIISNVIDHILTKEKITFPPKHSQQIIDDIRQKIYKELIIFVDAQDNGIDKVNDKDATLPTTLWSRVGKLNPMWWEETYNEQELFSKAMQIVEEEFYSQVRQCFL